MIYNVSHRTTYRYSIPVSFSHHRLHLAPRPCDHQVCRRTVLSITPTPSVQSNSTDYFGNPVTNLTLQDQHTELTVHNVSTIEVLPAAQPSPTDTLVWTEVYPRLFADTSDTARDAIQYAFATPLTTAAPEIADYAARSFPDGRPVLEGVLDLTRRIFKDFVYDSTATTISTPLDQVFAKRRGVCQDFAHLEIACLRALRLPARYVSGYLLTHPPEGQERRIGADASHAWLSVWCPDHGWVDVDPTNNLVVADEHVTIAWGRDYSDVSPITGAIFGGGSHTIDVAVYVVPTNAAQE